MSWRGVDFLEVWTDQHVPYTGRQGDPIYARKLARRLIAEAAMAGLTLEDLTLGDYSPEVYILEALSVTLDVTTELSGPFGQPPFPSKSRK